MNNDIRIKLNAIQELKHFYINLLLDGKGPAYHLPYDRDSILRIKPDIARQILEIIYNNLWAHSDLPAALGEGVCVFCVKEIIKRAINHVKCIDCDYRNHHGPCNSSDTENDYTKLLDLDVGFTRSALVHYNFRRIFCKILLHIKNNRPPEYFVEVQRRYQNRTKR